MNRADAKRLLDEADIVCTSEEVQAAVDRMARELTDKLKDEFPVVLAVMGGAAVFTGQILPKLQFPLEFGAIQVTRYKGTKGRDISWQLPPRDNVKDRTVLVIDDILDEGVTLAEIRKTLGEMGAKTVYAAVFADKALEHEKAAHADFIGVTVPDRYVFGFGMDAYGLWRNLPAIYALKKA